MEEQELEKRNKKTGMMVSAGVHALLLLAFLFILAWREPDPPLPEYGIELNFGISDVGSGDVQPETPPSSTDNTEEAAPEAVPEETVEEPVEEAEVVEETIEEPIEEIVETNTSTQESPDVLPEEESEPEQPVEEKPEEIEEKKEPAKPVVTEQREEPGTGAEGADGEADQPQQANQGDNVEETGDKGDEQGTLDSRALYGQQGGGGGSSLEMAGWTWDFIPKPNDTSNENGRIVFEIKIDDMGEIISVRTLERSVSPDIEKIYRAEVEKLTFSKTSGNTIVAPVSTGRITFVIKSR